MKSEKDIKEKLIKAIKEIDDVSFITFLYGIVNGHLERNGRGI